MGVLQRLLARAELSDTALELLCICDGFLAIAEYHILLNTLLVLPFTHRCNRLTFSQNIGPINQRHLHIPFIWIKRLCG